MADPRATDRAQAPRRSRARGVLAMHAPEAEAFELQDAETAAPVAWTPAGFDALTHGERAWMYASVVTVVLLISVGLYMTWV